MTPCFRDGVSPASPAGLTSLWLAATSPLDALSGLFLTAHMTQHLVLTSWRPR